MANLLLVRPSYDSTTATLHQWGDDVRQAVQSSGSHQCRDLSRSLATRTETDTNLLQPTDCLVFYGHGDSEHLFAQNGAHRSPAAVDRSNCHLLRDKVVYAVACDSVLTLGVEAVNNHGARAYVGYDDIFGVVLGGPELLFRRAANAAILFLLAGTPGSKRPCDAAVSFAKTEYDSGIRYYSRGAGVGHTNYALAAAWLRWNRDSLRLLGDPNATL